MNHDDTVPKYRLLVALASTDRASFNSSRNRAWPEPISNGAIVSEELPKQMALELSVTLEAARSSYHDEISTNLV